MDIVDKETRSRMMSNIRAKNTKPELVVRKALFARGFRYKLHDKNLPGNPDLVFPKYKAIIFIHGCFWHKHDCHLFKWPKTRTKFWKNKILSNIQRDKANINALQEGGWRILIVWECNLKGKYKSHVNILIDRVENWLLYGENTLEITPTE